MLMTSCERHPKLAAMDRQNAMERLPEAHARALRMRDSGLSHQEIAHSLEAPLEAVGTILAIAEAKLSALLSEPAGNTGASTGTRSDDRP
jgi:DNA-directed RNA polymerase specialized sigma24 family protein